MLQLLYIQHPIIIREQSKVNKTSSHLRNITLTWSYMQAITYITTLHSKSHFLQKRAFGVMPTPHTLKCTRRLEPLDLHAAKRKGKRHEMIALLQPYGKAWHSTHTWWGSLDPASSAPSLGLSCRKRGDKHHQAGRRRTVCLKAEPYPEELLRAYVSFHNSTQRCPKRVITAATALCGPHGPLRPPRSPSHRQPRQYRGHRQTPRPATPPHGIPQPDGARCGRIAAAPNPPQPLTSARWRKRKGGTGRGREVPQLSRELGRGRD